MSQYAELGVDAGKKAVRAAFTGVKNDFPGAFINIVRSKIFPGYVKTQHGDGDGSKSILRMLMYYITKDVSWLYGMLDDGWSMNFSDVAAGGFVEGEFMVTDIVNLNAFHVPKEEILKAINARVQELLELYGRYGFDDISNAIHFLGGETADLPRQVQTSVFDITVSGCMREEGVIKGNVQPGDRIWGFASDGQAAWETEPNSGIMANGLTLGIKSLVHPKYVSEYPHLLTAGATFTGAYSVDDASGVCDMSIAEALLSPTRQWAILIKMIIDELRKQDLLYLLHGITVNTGGGATKVLHLGTGGISYHKTMPDPPGIFHLIQDESVETWRNMQQTFNCGVGIDVIGHQKIGGALRVVEEKANVVLYDLGKCLPFEGPGNKVGLQTPFGFFDDY